MLRTLFIATVFSALFVAACGGGGGSGVTSKPTDTAGGARAMAAAMEADLTKLRDCFQAEIDGKGACTTNLLTTQTTSLCSDVHTGKSNTFGVSNYKAFDAVCASWASMLSTPLAERPAALTAMIDKTKAIN